MMKTALDLATEAVKGLTYLPPDYSDGYGSVHFMWVQDGGRKRVGYQCQENRITGFNSVSDCAYRVLRALGLEVDTRDFISWDQLKPETITALTAEGITRKVPRPSPGKAAVKATPPAGPAVYPEQPVAVDTAFLPVSKEPVPMNIMPTATASLSATGIGSTIGTILGGGPVGGVVGTVIGEIIGGAGKSKCPGPYNYDPATGGCVPKPGFAPTRGGTGPGNQTIPTGTGGVPGAVGVTSPGVMSTVGWSTGMDERGNVYAEPAVFSRLQRRCPPGMVLDRNGLCYRKGTPGLLREWKPSSRAILSAQDAKTLRKIASIQKRVRKAAGSAGFTCKKR